MKKATALILSTLAAAAMFTSCGNNDGDVSSDNSSHTAATSEAERNEETVTTKNTEADSDKDDSDIGDTLVSKADGVGDDIADGIDDGLDATESVVDDILR